MDSMIANDVLPETLDDTAPPSGVLGKVEVPVQAAAFSLASSRRYELATSPEGDRLTVRGRGGVVLLRVLMTDEGPLLAFESADVEIAAAGRLALSGREVSIAARESLALTSGGHCTQAIAGARHTRVGAVDRLEAGSVQTQANEGALEMKAAGRIGLDGEHIGLNDDPCPQPFGWSAAARALEGAQQA